VYKRQDYIMGVSDDKERSLLEGALSSDETLGTRLDEHRLFIQGIEAYHNQALKNKLKDIHRQNIHTTPVKSAKRRSLMPWLAAAATVALLVVALTWMNNTALSNDQLFASNFEPYELGLTQRGDTEATLMTIEQLYSNGQYQEAIPLFETLIEENEDLIYLQLGAGVSKLANNQAQEALTHFEVIIDRGDLLFKDHAIWYSALAYLKLGNSQKAKSTLQILVDDTDADYHKEAMKLSAQLK